MTHKFLGLQDLHLSLDKRNVLTDQYVVARLLTYAYSVDKLHLWGLRMNTNNFMQIIGNTWEKSLKLGIENVQINNSCISPDYIGTSLEISRKGTIEERTTILKYHYSSDLKRGSYMSLIENSGKFIGALLIEVEHVVLSRSETPNNFFPLTLAYCPNLKILKIRGCRIKEFNNSNLEYYKRTSIAELCLEDCEVEPGIFEQLSLLLYEVKQLCLRNNSNYTTDQLLDESVDISSNLPFKIVMTQTNINCITFGKSWTNQIIYVKIFSTVDKECHYYEIDSTLDGCIRSSTEQEYKVKNYNEHVYVHCPSNPRIQFNII